MISNFTMPAVFYKDRPGISDIIQDMGMYVL